MDVTLPDGRTLTNVPEGTTQEEILAKLRSAGEDISWAQPKQPTGPEMAAKDTGFWNAMMIGAGKKTNDILNGLTQLYLGARGEGKALSGLAQNVQESNALFAPLRQQRPIATGLGEALPAMAVPGAGASYGGAFVAGALPEALSYGSASDRALRGAVSGGGAMVGRAIGGLITNVLKPAGAGVNADSAAMAAADRIGFKPLAGQATQNPALMNIENYLSRRGGSSGTMQSIAQAQKEALNAAAAKSVGMEGTDLSGELLSAAQQKIGSEFQRLQEVTAPQLGDDFVNALQKIETQNAAKGPFRNPQIDKLIQKGLDLAAKGNLSGQAYKEIRSELSAEAQSAFKSEGGATVGQALKTVRNALDEAAKGSLSEADKQAWDVAREQWGAWKLLTKGNVAEAGDVSAARVAQGLRARGPGFRLDQMQGPLADVGRIGEGFKGPLNPNSGALLAAGPMSWLSAPVNYVAVQTYTAPTIQKWLTSGIVDIGRNGELIVKATGVPLGVVATKNRLGVE